MLTHGEQTLVSDADDRSDAASVLTTHGSWIGSFIG